MKVHCDFPSNRISQLTVTFLNESHLLFQTNKTICQLGCCKKKQTEKTHLCGAWKNFSSLNFFFFFFQINLVARNVQVD